MRLPLRRAVPWFAVLTLTGCGAAAGPPPASPAADHSCLDHWGSPRRRPCSLADITAQRTQFALIDEAQRNHRSFLEARDALASAGGAQEASPAMRQFATEPMLGDYVGFLREQQTSGRRVVGTSQLRFPRPHPHTEGADVALEVCLDGRSLTLTDRGSTASYPGRLIEGVVFYRRVDGVLKLARGRQQPVEGCASP